MWIDLHREIARQRHADRLREAEHARLAAQHPTRPALRLRVGRLQLSWDRVSARGAHETG